MRTEFINTLYEIARKDRNVILITGDLGFGVLDKFAKDLPEQFINAGVAEQNMTGLATGLALEGKTVFTYSIANFPTLRCLEQIRNDVCYHNANVKIVSVGGGFSYGPLGMSHHATEDLSIMRILPNMTVVAPGDIIETRYATEAIYKMEGPCYLRLGRNGEGEIHKNKINFKLGKAINLFEGKEIVIISIGNILKISCQLREILNKLGYEVGLYSMHTLKPLDIRIINKISLETKLVISVEENINLGGLGNSIEKIIHQIDSKTKLLIYCLDNKFVKIGGTQEYLRNKFGLSIDKILNEIITTMKKINN